MISTSDDSELHLPSQNPHEVNSDVSSGAKLLSRQYLVLTCPAHPLFFFYWGRGAMVRQGGRDCVSGVTWVWVRACSTAAAVQLRHTRCIQGLLHRGAVQDDILHSFRAMNSGLGSS